MKTTIALFGIVEALHDVLLPEKLVVLDGLVDFDNVLPDDTTSTSVEMAKIETISSNFQYFHNMKEMVNNSKR